MNHESIGKKITPKKLAKLNQIYAELDDISEKTSDALKNAKRFKNEMAMVKKPEGVQMIKQGFLWEEVRIMGKGAGESYEALQAIYPEVFELSEKQAQKREELTVFCHTELGVDPVALRLRDILNLIDKMLDYKLASLSPSLSAERAKTGGEGDTPLSPSTGKGSESIEK